MWWKNILYRCLQQPSKGPAREAFLILSPPLAGLDRNHGLGPKAYSLKSHDGSCWERNRPDILKTWRQPCPPAYRWWPSFKTVCPTCPRPLSQSDRHTHHRAWAFPITLTCTLLSLVCTKHEPLTPWFQFAPGALDLVLFLASLSFMLQFFLSKLQLAWPCGASLLQCTDRIFSGSRPNTSGFDKMLLVASNRNPMWT